MATRPAHAVERLVHAWLRVQPGDGRRVALMMLYSAAAMGGVLTVGMAVSSALFLSRLPPSSTAYLFILPAVFIVPVILAYNRVAARIPLQQAVLGSNLVLLVLTLLFRLLLETPAGTAFWALAGIYLFNEISYTLVLLQFWTVAGQIFNARDAKRLYGPIAAGGTLANVVAGLSLAAIGAWIGVANLLIVVAGALALCILSVWLLGDAVSAGQPAATVNLPGPERHLALLATLRAIAQSPLLRSIAALTVLLSLLVNIAVYQFFVALQVAFSHNAADMVIFTGRYGFWSGLAALFAQIYLTRRLMSRWGVFAALLCFPLGVAIGAGTALASGGALWAITLTVAGVPVFRRTITSAAINVLYLAVSPSLRQRAGEIMEGIYALSFGLLGVMFLIEHTLGLTYLSWSIPAIGIAAAWLIVLAGARKPYLRALAESIAHRRLDLSRERIDLTDPAAIRVLTAALRGTDSLRTIQALRLIADMPGVTWNAAVLPLLDHPSPEVRILALGYLGRGGNALLSGAQRAYLHDTDVRVRVAAIAAYAAGAGPHAVRDLAPLLDEPEPRIVGAAIVALVAHGGPDGEAQGWNALERLLSSTEAAMRLEGVRALGMPRMPNAAPVLPRLLDDPDHGVQIAAIRVAGALGQRAFVPILIAKLADRATARAAIDALARQEPGVEPLLAEALASAEQPAVRAGIAQVCERLGTAAAAAIVLAHIHETDLTVRAAIYRALTRLYAGSPRPVPRARIRAALAAEMRAAYTWYAMLADLSLSSAESLRGAALEHRAWQAIERAFDLLALLYAGPAVAAARRALAGARGTRRPEAVELLDNLLTREDKSDLLPLLEAPVAQIAEIGRRRFDIIRQSAPERLAALAHETDPWLCACALHEIAARHLGELEGLVQRSLRARDDLVRETAQRAYERLNGGDAPRTMAGDHAVAPEGRHGRVSVRRLRGAEAAP